ncbi:hypothetical protein C8J56DRAFT_1168687 [Mycena floridula]|nr:hypothetical protein C8J56DRAFT_1168687 [Mycena floridula]
MTLNILAIGASKNIGYHAALRFLESGAHITFLLRNPSCFDADTTIQRFASNVDIIKGDALVKSDVQSAWDKARSHGNVDIALCTIGGTGSIHITKGVILDTPNIVTESLLNLLCCMPKAGPPPKIIVVTAGGLCHTRHTASVPLLLKPVYSYLLPGAHADKVCAERVAAHCAGWTWNDKEDGKVSESILEAGWKRREGLPAAGSLADQILIVRPMFLGDGECRSDAAGKPAYRIGEDILKGYSISRKDVAYFIQDASNRWDEFKGKRITIAY